MAPFNLGRSVSTHSPYHGRLREGRAGIKIEVVCKEVGSGAGGSIEDRFPTHFSAEIFDDSLQEFVIFGSISMSLQYPSDM